MISLGKLQGQNGSGPEGTPKLNNYIFQCCVHKIKLKPTPMIPIRQISFTALIKCQNSEPAEGLGE